MVVDHLIHGPQTRPCTGYTTVYTVVYLYTAVYRYTTVYTVE